jgi:hypothetical protein
MEWSIPDADDIDVVTKPPYGDNMTMSFRISGQWYTLPWSLSRRRNPNSTNIEIMNHVTSRPREFGLVRYRANPDIVDGIIYVIEKDNT